MERVFPSLFKTTASWIMAIQTLDENLPKEVQHVFLDHLVDKGEGKVNFTNTRIRLIEGKIVLLIYQYYHTD